MFRKRARVESPATAIERMALQNVLDDKPFGDHPKKFPCRVVFRFLDGSSGSWFSSCRGKNWTPDKGESNRVFETEGEATAWLQAEGAQ